MRVTINNTAVDVPSGCTVLQAAAAAGVVVPTMCQHQACPPQSSCMVCVVRDTRAGRLLPACVAPAEPGMAIETDSPEVHAARRTALELLLSEHVGDCQAPCTRSCPAHLDAPRMIRQIMAGDAAAARQTLRAHIAVPRVIAALCHAPCEKACRRSRIDAGVAIRSLEGFVATLDPPPTPAAAHDARHVVVVGAGPAGLAAAYHLRLLGHAVTVLDSADAPGGTLLAVPPAACPGDALAADLAALRDMGVAFAVHAAVAEGVVLDALRQRFAAVVLAIGQAGGAWLHALGLAASAAKGHAGAAVLSSGSGLFACGSMVRPRPHIIQALADGQSAAFAADRFLSGLREAAPPRFDSHTGPLSKPELAEFMKGAHPRPRIAPADRSTGRVEAGEAVQEAQRCMHCDCRRQDDCKLRDYADAYGASQAAFRSPERQAVSILDQHAQVVYEPGKCIRCGLCVAATAQAGEALGLTFIGRGFDVRVGVPFSESLQAALQTSAADCVAVCPTGALARREP